MPTTKYAYNTVLVCAMCGTKPAPTLPQSGPSFTATTTKTSMQSPPNPKIRSIHSNVVTQITTAKAKTASTMSHRYGRPERSWSAIATPPSSAASVIRLTTSDETSATNAPLKP